ncbi:MAG: hypothetical protein ACRDLM_12260 [Gaiellaceae bacterium]
MPAYTGDELAQVTDLLDRASAEIRSAIGQVVTRVIDETISLPVITNDQTLELPEQPVVSVSAVAIDGAAVTDYKKLGGTLWRWYGWQQHTYFRWTEPAVVTVTYTHGVDTVPKELQTLCLALASAAKAQLLDGETLGDPAGVTGEAIDDYRRNIASGADAVPHVMTLPEGTVNRLRARYGTGAATVSMG